MIFLFSSAGHEIYKQFILQVLCYPRDYILASVPYSLDLVQEKFTYNPEQLVGKNALIIFVDYDTVDDRYLFSLGLEFVEELNRREVSEALLEQFRSRDKALTPPIRVEVEQAGSKCRIIDANTVFSVRNEDRTLNVYDYRIVPVFFPLRKSHIIKAVPFAGKLLLDLKLGKFIYYDDKVQRAYYDTEIELEPRRRWNKIIKQEPSAPRAVPRPPYPAINPFNSATWKSSGMFVMEVEDGIIELNIDPQKENERAERHDDWKSIVDMIALGKQLDDKLFYQIELTRPEATETLPVTIFNRRTVYQLNSGDYLDLAVHFYHGKKKKTGAKKILETVVDSNFISTIGRTSIEVYPEQHSGKVEKILLIVKKQLSKDVTRVIIRENTTGESSLANVELYLSVKPRMSLIAYILILFFLGSLLNAVPPDPKWLWVLKVIGAALMALSFWLAFSKFPVKS